jgi:hypothetical protein
MASILNPGFAIVQIHGVMSGFSKDGAGNGEVPGCGLGIEMTSGQN